MMALEHKKMKVFAGNANPKLAAEICRYLGIQMGNGEVRKFSDGEIQAKIDESVRGADVFVIQPTCGPVNDNIMELLIMIDALRRASARRITAVIPYYGYARQDRKARARDPITAKLFANLITVAGARRILTMDLHATQIQGFFDIPLDQLLGVSIMAKYLKEKDLQNPVVVAPDVGSVKRARDLSEKLNCGMAIIDKRRPEPNVSEVMNIIGDIKDKTAIMVDDIIDTAGTITAGAQSLLDMGAKDVYACCVHPVLSGPAIDRIKESPLKEVVVTNTIPLTPEKQIEKIKSISVAPLFGEAISRIYEDMSVSSLFD